MTFSKKSVLSFLLPVALAYMASTLLVSYSKITSSLPNPLPQLDGGIAAAQSDFERGQEEADYYEQLLADSILSIVKTYYVDAQRVNNANLLHLTLDSLASNLGFNVSKHGPSFRLQINGKILTVKDVDTLTYEQLLRTLTVMAKFLDASKTLTPLLASPAPDPASLEAGGMEVVVNAMLMALDAHSNLLSSQSYDELKQGTEGTFGGLGVLVGMRDQLLTVIKPLPHSPAERGGIAKRDRILAIDGRDTYGFSLGDLVDYMKGAPGSTVKLSLLRENAVGSYDVDLQREVIMVDSVSARVLKKPFGNLLIVAIESFSARTGLELEEAIASYHRQYPGPLKGIVLDLRSNPGGLLDQAVKVVDQFIPSGIIVSTKGRREEREVAHRQAGEESCPMVVLINEDSASASEIVAGALQDHGRAVILGQPSFGKGSVQTIFELPHNQALKLTIARYYTPSGRSIQNVGITPDIWVQPVFKQGANHNLLGAFRYRSERFLTNHLVTGARSPKALGASGVLWQGFYLAQPSDEFGPEDKEDRELELAAKIFDRVYEVYKGAVPQENSRVSHWLAVAAPTINRSIGGWDQEVGSYLSLNHQVNWQRSALTEGLLSLHMDGPKEVSVKPGDEINLAFTIRNGGPQNIGRVSVYLRSSDMGVDTTEHLVGLVKAGTVHQGKLKLKIPAYWQAGKVSLETGLAVAGYPIGVKQPVLDLMIGERPTPGLTLVSRLSDERGGRVDGKLEAGEVASLVVDITNASDFPSRQLTVKLLNLTGTQLVLASSEQKVHEIAPHMTTSVRFKVQGGAQVVSKVMAIGLSVESNDFDKPFREKLKVDAVASGVRSVEKILYR